MASTNQDNHKAAWDRRFFYGGNVAAMVLGVLVILVFANWLAHRSAVRIDWTATRMYSLSDQTRRVLDDLDKKVTVTTVFGVSGSLDEQTATNMQHFRDLLDEYARRGGGRIEVEHIAAGDFRAFDRFAGRVTDAYADRLDAARQTISAALDLFDAYTAYAAQQAPRFAQAATTLGDKSPGLREQLQLMADQFTQLGNAENMAAQRRRVEQSLDETLPDYNGTLSDVRLAVTEINDSNLAALAALFKREAEADDNPAELKSFFAESLAQVRPLEEEFAQTLARFDGVDLTEYDTVRENLTTHDSVVVTAEGKLATVALRDVFMTVAEDNPDGTTIEQRFRGEEAVTGAMLSLTTDARTKVVFVDAIGNALDRVFGAPTGFDHLKQRLRSMGMEVVDWNPAPPMTGRGSMPPPRPTAEPGQTLVWVFLRTPPINPQQPGGLAALQINEALGQIVEGDDPVLVMATLSQMAEFRQPDPVADHLKKLGIAAETSVAVYAPALDPDGNIGISRGHQVVVRPDEHPVAKALAGQLVVSIGVPLASAGDETRFWTLVQTERDTWADDPFVEPRQDPDDPTGPFTIAAAAQVGQRRAVALSDDLLDIRSPRPSMYCDARLVERFGVITPNGIQENERMILPGNAELFVNSVYWLAGRDELIATSARSQDVRRLGHISPAAKATVGWTLLAGLPLACVVLGLCVGVVRRK